MKRFLMLLFVVALAFCLCGCDSGSEASDSLETVEVIEPDYRQIYYDAVKKTVSETRYGYDVSISDMMIYPDGENVIAKNGHVELNGSECTAVFNDGGRNINLSYFDGYIYSDESGGNFKAPMEKAEFDGYLESRLYSVVGVDFAGVFGTENDDGTYTVSFNGVQNTPETLAEHFQKLGMSDVVLRGISGKAEIDKNGYITKRTVTAQLSMNEADAAIKCTYSAEVNYVIGGERAMARKSDDNFIEVDDINTPMLIKGAYENILGHSYNASYETLYEYAEGEKEYSMELNYSQSVKELPVGFEAFDETVIRYDTVKSGRTVEKSSEYSTGEREIADDSAYYTEEMTDASARSVYYQMLMDYEPDMKLIKNIGIKDMGNYFEIEYEYAEENAMLYCQNVLTALVNDQEGIAVHSEDHTIESALSTMRIDKASGVLMAHEIDIIASFNDGENSFTVGFEHVLRVS